MSAGCAVRTMNQPLACYFRCARRTLHWFIELIRALLDTTASSALGSCIPWYSVYFRNAACTQVVPAIVFQTSVNSVLATARAAWLHGFVTTCCRHRRWVLLIRG